MASCRCFASTVSSHSAGSGMEMIARRLRLSWHDQWLETAIEKRGSISRSMASNMLSTKVDQSVGCRHRLIDMTIGDPVEDGEMAIDRGLQALIALVMTMMNPPIRRKIV